MGIDYDSKLIIGFELDSDKINEWMSKHDIEDPGDVSDEIRKILSIPETKTREENPSVYVIYAGDCCNGFYEYYLTFFCTSTKVGNIKMINEEHLELAKKAYKELMDTELDCKDVDSIPIYSVNYTW